MELSPNTWGGLMRKASEYRKNACECRELAERTRDEAHRAQLLSMAAQWDQLARFRAALIRKHPDLAAAGEREEEAGA